MLEVNQAYEAAIRRDPANWFWVHNRWKPGKHRKPAATSEAPSESGETVEATDPTSLV